MQIEVSTPESPSRTIAGSATKRSKRGSSEWLRAEDGSWVPESELDTKRPVHMQQRKDTAAPLTKLVRTMSLEVPDRGAASSSAPAASAEPSTSFNNVWQKRPEGEGFTTVDPAAAASEAAARDAAALRARVGEGKHTF